MVVDKLTGVLLNLFLTAATLLGVTRYQGTTYTLLQLGSWYGIVYKLIILGVIAILLYITFSEHRVYRAIHALLVLLFITMVVVSPLAVTDGIVFTSTIAIVEGLLALSAIATRSANTMRGSMEYALRVLTLVNLVIGYIAYTPTVASLASVGYFTQSMMLLTVALIVGYIMVFSETLGLVLLAAFVLVYTTLALLYTLIVNHQFSLLPPIFLCISALISINKLAKSKLANLE